MTVLELMATMGIDTTAFDDGLSKAVENVEGLSDKAEELTTPSLGGNGQSSLKPLIDDAETVDAKLLEMQTKTKETSAVVEVFVSVIGEVVEKGIESIIEFGAQSIEAAAATGSELANAFNESKSSFGTSLDILKVKVGEAILPIATAFYEVSESIMGITGEEKLEFIAQQLQSYSDLNLEKIQENLSGVFDTFEKVEAIKPGSLDEYRQGIESQTEYWKNYADTLGSLKEKGVDPEFLAEVADGSKESMEMISALDAADASGLEGLLAAYESMKTAQEAAAQGISETQLSADETMTGMLDSMAAFVSELDQSDTAQANASATVEGVVSGLSEKFPAVETWVDEINQKLAELGLITPEGPVSSVGESGHGGKTYKPFGEQGEGGEETTFTADVWLELNEDSEGNLQSAVDGMSIEGDASLYADPRSAGLLQSYCDSLTLTATVELVPTGSLGTGSNQRTYSKRAVGLDYVPHDDYLASLHEGEAVLTKLEATRWRTGEDSRQRRAAADLPPIIMNITVSQNEDFEQAVKNVLDMLMWQG